MGRFLFFQPEVIPASLGPAPTTIEGRIAQLEALASAGAHDPTVFQRLGASYIALAAQTSSPILYSAAEEALDRAEALAPGQMATLTAQATLATLLHRFEAAEELATQALDIDPTNIEALAALADAQVELGRYEEAGEIVQEMLQLDPGVSALARASYLRQLNGDITGALELMHQARVAAGTPYMAATVDSLVGDVYAADGQYETALAFYEQAAENWPRMTSAATGQARSMAHLGRTDEAVAILQAEVDRLPAIAPAILLGDLLTTEGRTDEAADAYELVAVAGRLQQEAGASVDLELAIFQADHEGGEVAMTFAESAYAARPDNIYAADAMAWALHRSGYTSEALPYIDRALRLGTRDARLLHHAAVILAAAGDLDRAAPLLSQAMDIDAHIAILHNDVRELSKRLGVATS